MTPTLVAFMFCTQDVGSFSTNPHKTNSTKFVEQTNQSLTTAIPLTQLMIPRYLKLYVSQWIRTQSRINALNGFSSLFGLTSLFSPKAKFQASKTQVEQIHGQLVNYISFLEKWGIHLVSGFIKQSTFPELNRFLEYWAQIQGFVPSGDQLSIKSQVQKKVGICN